MMDVSLSVFTNCIVQYCLSYVGVFFQREASQEEQWDRESCRLLLSSGRLAGGHHGLWQALSGGSGYHRIRYSNIRVIDVGFFGNGMGSSGVHGYVAVSVMGEGYGALQMCWKLSNCVRGWGRRYVGTIFSR